MGEAPSLVAIKHPDSAGIRDEKTAGAREIRARNLCRATPLIGRIFPMEMTIEFRSLASLWAREAHRVPFASATTQPKSLDMELKMKCAVTPPAPARI